METRRTVNLLTMKTKLLFFLLLLVCSVSAQEVSDSYKVVTQENDSTWLVRQYDVYEYSLVFNGLEYTFSDTVLIPDQTAYYDSAGLVRYLLVSTTNEQNEQAAVLSRAFDAATTLRNVLDANTLINTITGGSSNY